MSSGNKPKYGMRPIYLYRQGESSGEVRVDRFPAAPRALTTIAQHTASFIGNITVEASIESEPTETDWFVISSTEYATFDLQEERSRNTLVNVSGRFIWMRVTVTMAEGFPHGSVDRITVI